MADTLQTDIIVTTVTASGAIFCMSTGEALVNRSPYGWPSQAWFFMGATMLMVLVIYWASRMCASKPSDKVQP